MWQRQMTRITCGWCTLCRMDELQEVAERLASRLHRAVAIDDPRMHLLVHTAHHGTVDSARMESILRLDPPADAVAYVRSLGIAKAERPLRVPGRPDLQLLPRVVAPLRADGLLIGYLWIIDEQAALTDADLLLVQDAAAEAAAALFRRTAAADARAARAQRLAQDLMAGDVAAAPALRAEELWTAEQVRVLRAETAGPVSREGLERAVRGASRERPVVVSTAPLAVVLVPPAADLTALANAVCDLTGASWCSVGSSAPLEEAARSATEAALAARVAAGVPPPGRLVDWDGLGVYRLLVQLPLDALPPGSIPAPIRALLDTEGGRELVRTVEAYLDRAGDARSTAAALNVHRTSLYYRLGRFTELTGLDLADGHQRLAVHLALKLVRLTG